MEVTHLGRRQHFVPAGAFGEVEDDSYDHHHKQCDNAGRLITDHRAPTVSFRLARRNPMSSVPNGFARTAELSLLAQVPMHSGHMPMVIGWFVPSQDSIDRKSTRLNSSHSQISY